MNYLKSSINNNLYWAAVQIIGHAILPCLVVAACHMRSQVKGKKIQWCLVHTDESGTCFPGPALLFLELQFALQRREASTYVNSPMRKAVATYYCDGGITSQ